MLRLIAAEARPRSRELRGPFALFAWNRERATLLVVRDQIGFEPMFYAQGACRLACCRRRRTSLAAQPGVSSEPDAVALSEWICGWFPAVEDTAYREVKRVPPGSSITYKGSDAAFAALLGSIPRGEAGRVA